jgi:hypothetical protein
MAIQIPPEVLVGGLTAGSALAGSYLQSRVNLQAQEKAIEAQNKRTSADYILQKEADALMELLEVAERCHAAAYQYVNKASAEGEVSDELGEELNEALVDFERAARTNTVFLKEEEREAVNHLLGTIQKSVEAGHSYRRGRTDVAQELNDWEELMNGFRTLTERLRPVFRDRISDIRE